jgi:hypothetical protein
MLSIFRSKLTHYQGHTATIGVLPGKATNSTARSHPYCSTFYCYTSNNSLILLCHSYSPSLLHPVHIFVCFTSFRDPCQLLVPLLASASQQYHTRFNTRRPTQGNSSWPRPAFSPLIDSLPICRNPLRLLSIPDASDNHLQPHALCHRYRAPISPFHLPIANPTPTGLANRILVQAA